MASQDQEHSETLDQIIRQYQELGRLLPQQQAAADAAAAGLPGLTKGLNIAGKAAGDLAGAFTNAMGAMYRGEKGLKAFDGAIDKTADALMVLAGAAALLGGPFTLLAAGLVAAIGATAKYVKAANEQSDKLYDAFQQMSRSGGAAADGLQGLYTDLQKLGLGVQDLDKFVGMIAANSQDLSLFGGTVFKGRKEFANLMREMEPFRAALMNAGLSQDEQNEATMGYIRLQSRLGLTQNRTTAELAEGARKYLIEQEALTKLTGMSRKEQEDQRKALQAEQIFQAKLLQLRNAGQLEAADELQATFLMLGGMATDAGKGFADTISGNLRSEAAQKLYRATQGESMMVQQELTVRQITAAEAAQRIARSLDATRETFGETQGALGNFDKTFISLAETTALTSRLLNGGLDAAYKSAKGMGQQMGITGDAVVEAELKRQTDTRLVQQRAMQNMQDFVRYGVEPATRATEMFAQAIEYVTDLLPGSGAAKAEYEAKKAAVAQMVALEKETAAQSQAIMTKRGQFDAEQDAEKRQVLKRELEAAEASLKTSIEARQALQKKLETPGAFKQDEGYGREGKGSMGMSLASTGAGALTGAVTGAAVGSVVPVVGTAIGAGLGTVAGAAAGFLGYELFGGPGKGKQDSQQGLAGTTATGGRSDLADIKFTGDSGGQGNFAKLPPGMQQRVLNAANEYFQLTGEQLQINSAFRDPADQQRLYDETVRAGRPGRGPTGMPVAQPGTSPHELGQAIDIQNYRDQRAVKAMNRQGLFQTVPNDPVHFSLPKAADGAVFSGPRSGYDVELHGTEAVIPLKSGAIPVSFPKEFTENMSRYQSMMDQVKDNLGPKRQNDTIAVSFPKEFVEGMSKYQFVMDQVKDRLGATNASPDFTQEAEAMKNRAMAAGGADAAAMLSAFRQMGEELRRQGEANLGMLENMLRAQETSNSINQKILQVSQ